MTKETIPPELLDAFKSIEELFSELRTQKETLTKQEGTLSQRGRTILTALDKLRSKLKSDLGYAPALRAQIELTICCNGGPHKWKELVRTHNCGDAYRSYRWCSRCGCCLEYSKVESSSNYKPCTWPGQTYPAIEKPEVLYHIWQWED